MTTNPTHTAETDAALDALIAARCRASLRRLVEESAGCEVFSVGTVGLDGAVDELDPLAFGNWDAVPAPAQDARARPGAHPQPPRRRPHALRRGHLHRVDVRQGRRRLLHHRQRLHARARGGEAVQGKAHRARGRRATAGVLRPRRRPVAVHRAVRASPAAGGHDGRGGAGAATRTASWWWRRAPAPARRSPTSPRRSSGLSPTSSASWSRRTRSTCRSS